MQNTPLAINDVLFQVFDGDYDRVDGLLTVIIKDPPPKLSNKLFAYYVEKKIVNLQTGNIKQKCVIVRHEHDVHESVHFIRLKIQFMNEVVE